MMSFLIRFLLVICLSSCGSINGLKISKIKDEIPQEKLQKAGITAFNQNYKNFYFDEIPYLFISRGGALIDTP